MRNSKSAWNVDRFDQAAILLWAVLNGFLIWRFAKLDFGPHFFSIEGAFISLANLEASSLYPSSWLAAWNLGAPSQNVYAPILHLFVVAAKHAIGLTPVRAYHLVTSICYAAMPISLYIFMRVSGAQGVSSAIAAVLISIFSPSAVLDSGILQDLGGAVSSQRMRVLSVYGEGPHVASLFLQPLAIAAFWPLAKYGGWWRSLLFAVLLAFLAGLNTPGTLAMVLLLGCAFLSLPSSEWRIAIIRVGLAGLLAFVLSLALLPLTYWSLVFANNKRMHAGFMSADQPYIVYLCLIAAMFLLSSALSGVRSVLLRFAVLSSVLFFIVVSSAKSEIFEFLPQAHRFHVEMEMYICVMLGIALQSTMGRIKSGWGVASIRFAFVVFVAICLIQMKARRTIDHVNVKPEGRVEFQAARWVDENLDRRKGRIFTSGSTSFWINAFSNHSQIGGCCDQGIANDITIRLSYWTNLASTIEEIGKSIDLARSLGVQAFVLPTQSSNDAYKDTKNSDKFDPFLKKLEGPAMLSIYSLGRTHDSLIHVVGKSDLVPSNISREGAEFPLAIHKFASALQAESRSLTERWLDDSNAEIEGSLRPGEVIVVQMNFSDGWRIIGLDHAIVAADGLGMITIDPRCDGPCDVKVLLSWQGQPLARWSSWAGIVAFLACISISAMMLIRRFVSTPTSALSSGR